MVLSGDFSRLTEPTTRSKSGGTKSGVFSRSLALILCSSALGFCLFTVPDAWADPALPYTVTITGIEDRALLQDVNDASDSVSLKDRPPASIGLLRARAERDRDRFVRLLQGHGYFGARVEVSLREEATPLEIAFQVDTGPAYPVVSADIRVTGKTVVQPHLIPSPEKVGLTLGKPFSASTLMDAQKALLRAFEKQGFPFPNLEERKIMVDHGSLSVTLQFLIDPGQAASFGDVKIKGIDSVKEPAIRHLVPWKEGDIFDVEQLELLQARLIRLGLFSSVRVLKGRNMDEKGRLPVEVSLTERKHRSIGAGISYKTDEGPGATALWEHRNLLREGERLTVSGTVSDFTASAESTFYEPFFLRRDQSLRLVLRVAQDQPDTYTSRNVGATASVSRQLSDRLKVGAGVGYKVSRVEQLGIRESFSYLFLPLDLEWDSSDDLLDPTKGDRFGLHLVPFYDPTGNNPEFLKSRLRYRRYLKPFAAYPLVFAAGLSLGTISGAARDQIPADERFYAGGGGSIRGYAYQSVGPFSQGEPIGGRSLLETAFEVRMNLTQRLGLVAFLDGGNAYTGRFPDFGETLRWGTGLGFRYFTPVGPLRLDVAFPLNRRPGIDDSFQIYASLGQAF